MPEGTLCHAWPRPHGLAQQLMGFCKLGRLAIVAGPHMKLGQAPEQVDPGGPPGSFGPWRGGIYKSFIHF
jgi:hypothetical protein